MRIVEDTPRRLVLREQPSRGWQSGGPLFFLNGLFDWTLSLLLSSEIIISREEEAVILQRHIFGFPRRFSYPLDEVKGFAITERLSKTSIYGASGCALYLRLYGKRHAKQPGMINWYNFVEPFDLDVKLNDYLEESKRVSWRQHHRPM